MKIAGWGRYPIVDAEVSSPRSLDHIIERIQLGEAIARGNGRSYGDSAISATNTIDMKYFNRMISFDCSSGQLVAQAGVLLADVIDTFLPKGWFPMVTPGTKYVTLGGMTATDVHGKNHHKEGSFGNCIDWLDVITSDGRLQRCSKCDNTELFHWTIGGMGLTGVILNIAIRLKQVSTSWIQSKTVPAHNIDRTIEVFEETLNTTYSVAWIDCLASGKKLGRSLIMLGEHAGIDHLPEDTKQQPLAIRDKKTLKLPINLPSFILNPLTVRLFNSFYYSIGKRKTDEYLIDWNSYFFPLDFIHGWQKIYGRDGFVQFQCVIPLKYSSPGITQLLETISAANSGSFLAVLKRFGKQESSFSFPLEGYTLALDFPMTKKTMELMNKLDAITIKHDGRFYLAKDSRMTASTFRRSEHRIHDYVNYRSRIGARSQFSSEQSKRLGL